MKKLVIYLFLFFMLLANTSLHSQTTKTVGTGGDYTTLQSAFTAINNKTLTGAIILQMISSTTETSSSVLLGSGELGVVITNQGTTNYTSTPTVTFSDPPSGTTATGTAILYLGKVIGITITNRGSGYVTPPTVTITGGGGTGATAAAYIPSYTSVKIYPTVSGVTISGSFYTPLIDLDGADNVTIDGSVGQAGSAADMIIANTISLLNYSAPAHTIRFINEASNNTIKYANLRNNTTTTNLFVSSIILFSTSSTGTTGNSNNTIEYCKLTKYDVNRPDGIKSDGSSTAKNQNNIIRYNEIYDLFKNYYRGIAINTNSVNFTIEGNSFYETATPSCSTGVGTEYLSCIYIASGYHTIKSNYFGGSAASAGGSNPWRHTQTGSTNQVFYCIYINDAALTGTTSIQGNVINNFNLTVPGGFYLMYVANGNADIGTETANILGSSTNADVIKCNGSIVGIWHHSSGTANIKGNTIGGFTNTLTGSGLTGINKIGTLGDVQNNIIVNLKGGTEGSGSQNIKGIYHAGNSSTADISGNSITNLVNSNTGNVTSGSVIGISLTNSSTRNVHSNTISGLKNSNANTTTGNEASIVGISGNTYGSSDNIYGNTITNLEQTRNDFTGSVVGIAEMSSSSAIIARNLIENLSVHTSSTGASIYGIHSGSNYQYTTGGATYSNNIISISSNSDSKIYGIAHLYKDANFYFNTVYIGGTTPASSTNSSYAFYNNNETIRNYRNNIFYNTRTNGTGATGKHYAILLTSKKSLTIDYNDYYAPGLGGVIGSFNSIDKTTLADWKAATGQDCSSLNLNPNFPEPDASGNNYIPTAQTLKAEPGTGITSDFGNSVTRNATNPAMGAWEYSVTPPVYPQIAVTSFSPSTINYGGTVIITGDNFFGVTSVSFNGGTAQTFTINSLTEISAVVPASAVSGKITVTSCAGSSTSTQDITIAGRLNGPYTVGTGGNYTSLSDAVTDLNNKGVDGPVTFLLNETSYSLGTNPLTINKIYGASAENTVTIKPYIDVSTTIVSGSDAGTLVIDKADYLILDGSDGTCTGKNMTISNTSSDAISAIMIKGGGNITVKNCIISTGNSGICIQKDAANNPSVNNLISGNQILQDNNVYASWYSPVSETAAGIFLSEGARNTTIEKNFIYNFKYKENNELKNPRGWSYGYDSGFGLYGIKVNISATDASNGTTLIKNNAIYDIQGSSGYNTSMDCFVQGIFLKSGGNIKIYNNSIYLTGDLGYISWAGSDCISACLGVEAGITNLDVRNNLFQNSMGKYTGSPKTVKTYAVYSKSVNTAFDNINYNDYYLETKAEVTQNLGYLPSVDIATIADLRTATGKDANSVSKLINFASSTNLNLTGTSIGDMYLAGQDIAGLTDDILCAVRNTPPYMGAYEKTDAPLPVTLASFTALVNGRNARLSWVTAEEENNGGFFVERIKNEELIINNWQNIGFVNGKGNTSNPTTYTFEDRGLNTGKYKYRLKQTDYNGNFEYFELEGEVEVGVPAKFELSQNYPNPFNPVTKIDFALPVDSKVSMMIYDVTGREIAKIVNSEFRKAGYHTVQFNGAGFSSGVYFYSIKTDKNVMTKKMLLVK